MGAKGVILLDWLCDHLWVYNSNYKAALLENYAADPDPNILRLYTTDI